MRLRYQGKYMAQYRCYFLDPENKVTSFKILDQLTDNLARDEADQLRSDRACFGVEVWSGALMIHREVKSAKSPGRGEGYAAL
jgi:hypothetical protein